MTRKQMADKVTAWLGLQDLSVYDESQLVLDELYRGTIDLLSRTRCVARCVHLHYTANTGVYVLDKNILSLVDVDDGVTRRARRDQTSNSSGVVGTVVVPAGSVVTDPFTFTLIRSDLLRINPTPSEDGDLDVWGVLVPQQMDQDTDSPGDEIYGAIPEDYQDAIVTYALWKCSDYADDQSGSYGERYRVLYEGQNGNGGRLAQIRSSINKRGTARGAPRNVRINRTSPKSTWVG